MWRLDEVRWNTKKQHSAVGGLIKAYKKRGFVMGFIRENIFLKVAASNMSGNLQILILSGGGCLCGMSAGCGAVRLSGGQSFGVGGI